MGWQMPPLRIVALACAGFACYMLLNIASDLRSIATDLHAGVGCALRADARRDSLERAQTAYITAWESWRHDSMYVEIEKPKRRTR
jgi:hypothetical protein